MEILKWIFMFTFIEGTIIYTKKKKLYFPQYYTEFLTLK